MKTKKPTVKDLEALCDMLRGESKVKDQKFAGAEATIVQLDERVAALIASLEESDDVRESLSDEVVRLHTAVEKGGEELLAVHQTIKLLQALSLEEPQTTHEISDEVGRLKNRVARLRKNNVSAKESETVDRIGLVENRIAELEKRFHKAEADEALAKRKNAKSHVVDTKLQEIRKAATEAVAPTS